MKTRVELQSQQIESLMRMNSRYAQRLNDHDFILEHTAKIMAMLCENNGWSIENANTHNGNTVDNPNFHIG